MAVIATVIATVILLSVTMKVHPLMISAPAVLVRISTNNDDDDDDDGPATSSI